MTAIRADAIAMRYPSGAGTVTALPATTIAVASGTSLAIMGPSGCGKSTLLGLLAGLATPTTGTVYVDGVCLSAMTESGRATFRLRTIGLVFQADNLLPFLTVAQNVSLQQAISTGHHGTGVARLATDQANLDLLGMADLADRLPDQLSGGQRRRVAVVRAVAHQPRIILADEPTGALDHGNAAAVLDLLIEVQHRLAATMVLVTHDAAVAARMDAVVALPGRPSNRNASHVG